MRCMQGVWYVETMYYNCHCVAIADSVREALRALRSDMRYLVTPNDKVIEVFALSQVQAKTVQKALTASTDELLLKRCYQCDAEVAWLAPDSRCGDCTRLTVEEIRG